jgi:Microtubule associated protein (MAP65/ASE1 family)
MYTPISSPTSTTDLELLASSTASSLQDVWSEIGLSEIERTKFLSNIGAQVVAVYKTAVTSQIQRRDDLVAEIDALKQDIKDLVDSMENREYELVC